MSAVSSNFGPLIASKAAIRRRIAADPHDENGERRFQFFLFHSLTVMLYRHMVIMT